MRLWIKILPYIIVEKLALEINGDSGYIRGRHIEKEIPVRLWRIYDGTWIVKSEKNVLEHEKAKYERKIEEIDKILGGEKDENV